MSIASVTSEGLRLMKKKCKCDQVGSIKNSRYKKNNGRVYYSYDYECGFISWYAPVNDARGYARNEDQLWLSREQQDEPNAMI